jgi:hypothetical protein
MVRSFLDVYCDASSTVLGCVLMKDGHVVVATTTGFSDKAMGQKPQWS